MNETEKRDRRDEKEEIRYHVIFYGQVQGVGFRYRAYYAAYQLGLTGWVRNCWDETVEMEVQGDEETITEMIKGSAPPATSKSRMQNGRRFRWNRNSVFISVDQGCFFSFSGISTRMISLPIWQMRSHGITKSSPWQKKPQNFTGPGRTSPVRCPVLD